MRLRVIAISLLLLAALAVVCNAQQTDYSGTAKLVLKLDKMPEMPPMPDNPAKAGGLVPTTYGFSANDQSGATFAERAVPQAPQAPKAPQGSLVQVTVFYSSDPAIKVNDSCTLVLDYSSQSMPYGLQSGLIDKLNPGTIVGVNDYTLSGSDIIVDTSTSNWQKNIFVVNAQDSGGAKNPFMINLNVFKQFPAFSSFPSNDHTTTPITMRPTLNFSLGMPSSFQNSGLFNFFSH